MKKMTDEEKIHLSNRHRGYESSYSNGKERGIELACDYYDTQIDAQAKTMEELKQLLKDSWQCIFELQHQVKTKPSTSELLNKISAVVYAGGVIKE